jgi:hypothetical protein
MTKKKTPNSEVAKKSAQQGKPANSSDENSKSLSGANQQPPADMPARWLDQFSEKIRDTFKQEKKSIIWGTIAGSSVLAAILGIAGDFILVPYKARYEARSAYESKLSELTLQNQNKDLDERRKAYEVLDKELEKIAKFLRTYVSTCEQVRNNPAAKGYVEFAKSSWDSLTTQLGEVTNAKNACHNINVGDTETGKTVDDVLGKLGLNLFSPEVLTHKEKNPDLETAMPEMDSAITNIRTEITKKRQQLTLNPQKQSSVP